MDDLRPTADPPPDQVEEIRSRLTEFNFSRTGYRDGRSLAIFVRDDEGRVVAGIYGWTWGASSYIDLLWVDEALRSAGRGSALLRGFEAEAAARGARTVTLTTHSFQAPDFYIRHGYTIAGKAPDYPHGHYYALLTKTLRPRT